MTKVLPSEWEAPDHLSLSEREFLVDRAETINGIIAASYLQCGQVLLQVRNKFRMDPELNGWLDRWIEKCLPFSRSSAYEYMRIAEAANREPEIAALAQKVAYKTLYQSLLLPGEARQEIFKAINNGEKVLKKDVESLKQQPEIQRQILLEKVEELEMALIQEQLTPNQSNTGRIKARLSKALSQLKEKETELKSLEKTHSTQELVLLQLKKQLNQKQVQIENITLDPEQNRQRELARTVVDATRGLDLLLSSLDRYSTDKPELGGQAIETIERKMDEVKAKLAAYYATS